MRCGRDEAFARFNVIDDFNCEALRIEIDTNPPARRIVRG